MRQAKRHLIAGALLTYVHTLRVGVITSTFRRVLCFVSMSTKWHCHDGVDEPSEFVEMTSSKFSETVNTATTDTGSLCFMEFRNIGKRAVNDERKANDKRKDCGTLAEIPIACPSTVNRSVGADFVDGRKSCMRATWFIHGCVCHCFAFRPLTGCVVHRGCWRKETTQYTRASERVRTHRHRHTCATGEYSTCMDSFARSDKREKMRFTGSNDPCAMHRTLDLLFSRLFFPFAIKINTD